MRVWPIVGIMGLTVLTGTRLSAAQEAPDPRLPGVRLLVVNRAKVRPEMLNAAEADATAIYRAAGIQTTWVNAGPADVSYDYAVDFVVMIVSGEETRVMAARQGAATVGFTVRGSHDGGHGGTAFVLFDRVEENAAKRHASISRVAGKVIAHEVGHLLLPPNSHSKRGIMRGDWDLRSGLLEYFTSAQAQAMRQQLTLAPGRAACRKD